MNRQRTILTGQEMRTAEEQAAENGISEWVLMQQAGRGAGQAMAASANGLPILVLCGTGNNGGDGYVAAETLRRMGCDVRVAAFDQPDREPAKTAANYWNGETISPESADPCAVFVDALFGTGLSRPLEGVAHAALLRLAAGSQQRIAFDLPSGVDSDTGRCLSSTPEFHRTLAFGALKPSHLLYPAAQFCGRVDVVPIDIDASKARTFALAAPERINIDPTAHKYQRGSVAVAAGDMPGAAGLAARAAQRAGAGFVTLAGNTSPFPPSSLVMREVIDLDARRTDAGVIGPGLGSGETAEALAAAFLSLGVPLVIDGDMFSIFADKPDQLFGRGDVMTPHEGEFGRFFGDLSGSKIDRARTAAARSGNVIVLKGADTVIASPAGDVAVNDHAHPRLAVAGSGDILAGIIAAEIARGRSPFDAACAGVWRHGDGGLKARDGMIAEDLLELIR
jgi:hydroxyethylthiazole kinase-like uncharacterized protein yjeF|tara:strand:- start:6407 stop:7759 length:1353 start_codon:yes stop_codon:yes gene_type:complete